MLLRGKNFRGYKWRKWGRGCTKHCTLLQNSNLFSFIKHYYIMGVGCCNSTQMENFRKWVEMIQDIKEKLFKLQIFIIIRSEVVNLKDLLKNRLAKNVSRDMGIFSPLSLSPPPSAFWVTRGLERRFGREGGLQFQDPCIPTSSIKEGGRVSC